MRILGLDLSLTGTGVCTLQQGIAETARLTSKLRGVARLLELERRLFDALELAKPEIVLIEGYAFGRMNQAHQMGEWGGVCRTRIAKWAVSGGHSVVLATIPPSTLKKFATGSGNAKKEQMILAVFQRFGMHCHTNDEADAVALAYAAAFKFDESHPNLPAMPAANRESLGKIETIYTHKP